MLLYPSYTTQWYFLVLGFYYAATSSTYQVESSNLNDSSLFTSNCLSLMCLQACVHQFSHTQRHTSQSEHSVCSTYTCTFPHGRVVQVETCHSQWNHQHYSQEDSHGKSKGIDFLRSKRKVKTSKVRSCLTKHKCMVIMDAKKGNETNCCSPMQYTSI